MKINSKGAVTFSVRNDDKDLYDLIESLPAQVGSDMLRAILRDGLEYQKLVNNNTVQIGHLSMLCSLRRMDLDEVIQPFFGEVESKNDVPKSTESDKKQVKEKTVRVPKTSKTKGKTESAEDAFDAEFGAVSQY